MDGTTQAGQSDDGPAKELIEKFGQMKAGRMMFDTIYQEIRDLIRPNAVDFKNRIHQQGASVRQRVWDDTATQALTSFAGGIHGYVTNPSARWFELSTSNSEIDRQPLVAAWLERASDAIYDSMSDSGGMFHQTYHEIFLDLGGFGTGVKFTWRDPVNGRLLHRSLPLQNCWLAESASGQVDTIFRELTYTTRQAQQEWGEICPEEIKKETNWSKEWKFLHAIYPRSDRNIWKPDTKDNMAWVSAYVFLDNPKIVATDGFRQFPCQCPRWSKMPGETYGRSPAMDCLALVRVLNSAQKILLQSSALAAAPPIVIENDGVFAAPKLEPWGIIRVEPGMQVNTLQLNGDISVNLQMIERWQNQIRQAFMADLFAMPDFGNRDRVTAQEVYEKRDDRLRQISPMLGRLEGELFNPDIQRQYSLLVESGRLPTPPPALRGAKVKISNISPAGMAQRSSRGMNILRFFSQALPLTQWKPDLLDSINSDIAIQEVAQGMNITRRAIYSDDQVAATREARASQAQQQNMAELAGPAAKALKDVADATATSPELLAV